MSPIEEGQNSAPCDAVVESAKPKKLSKKSFWELFSRAELLYYGIAAVIYIGLGILFKNLVLNWVVGPWFIVFWMWFVPVLVDKWRARRS